MARTPVLLTTLVVLGVVQLQAQEHVWTIDRPDGVAPIGVFGDRTLASGALELTAIYSSSDHLGIRFGTEVVSIDQTLDLFDVAPLSLATELLEVRLGLGLTDRLTLAGRIGIVSKERQQVTTDQFFIIEVSDVSDTEVHLLWEVTNPGGAVRAHLQGGLSLPTGSIEESADVSGIRTGVLPYDMQTGAGVVGALPGATAAVQNEVGTVGGQIMGRIYFGENDRGWRPGNAVEFNGWASYKVSDYVSVTARVNAIGWDAIDGFDAELNPFRDPGELGSSYAGERVNLPVGLNIYIPTGPLAGHRLSFEWVANVHEDLDGPWLAADDGFNISWQVVLGGN